MGKNSKKKNIFPFVNANDNDDDENMNVETTQKIQTKNFDGKKLSLYKKIKLMKALNKKFQ